jgi:hypothetical protein
VCQRAPSCSLPGLCKCAGSRGAEDIDSADLSGVSSTPTFFVNGRRHYGARGRRPDRGLASVFESRSSVLEIPPDARIVTNQPSESGRLYRLLKAFKPRAAVTEYVGTWAHSKELHASTRLPLALVEFDLIARVS